MWTWIVLVAGALTGLASGPVLRTLPESAADLQEGKPRYADLASRRFSLAIASCAVAAGLVLIATLPPAAWPVWVPLATIGVLLAGIDAVTTWLPLALTRALWLATGAATGVQILLAPSAERGPLALRMVLGATAVGAFFWVFWRLTGGLGFGDVRLAPVLGAALASVSWNALLAGLLLGTVLGAIFGVLRQLRKHTGPFPYGPALVAGAFWGLVLTG